jgi:peptide deformylase
MILKIFQAGNPVLRHTARQLIPEEILSPSIQQLIECMKETMHDAPGVGLAAPQIGESLQLILIHDLPEYTRSLTKEQIAERERSPVPFHVIINPVMTVINQETAEFYEGCLSIEGFVGVVSRAKAVQVTCLNEKAETVTLDASGWYARILQHEIDHLHGKLCIDRMQLNTFSTRENYQKFSQ